MKGKVLDKMTNKKFLLSSLCAMLISCSDDVGWNNREQISYRDLVFDEELYGTGQNGFSEIFSFENFDPFSLADMMISSFGKLVPL